MSVTTPVEAEIANFFWRNQSTVPRIGSGSSSRIGLCSADPGETGTTTNEITTIGSRVALTSGGWDVPTTNEITRTSEVSWSATATEAATHWLIGVSSTVNTDHDFSVAFPSTVNFVSGDTVRFRQGTLSVKVTGLFGYSEGTTLLRNLLANQSIANVATVYFGLSTTAPNPDGTNVTEPSGGSYARVNHPLTTSYMGVPSGGSPTSCANTFAVTFPTATGGWGTVSHWVAYTASTGGTFVYYGQLDSSELITTGLQPQFAVGDLVFTID